MFPFLVAYSGWGTIALRSVIGIVFLIHGLPKVKNPAGIAAAVWSGSTTLGSLHGLVEVLGGLALIADIFLAPASLVLSVIMVGAIYFKIVKWKVPFMVRDNTGWEFDLVVLAGLLTLLLG